MGAKRASTSSPKRPVGRPSKAAKRATDPEAAKYMPITDLLSEYCDVDGSCKKMLQAALPLALQTLQEQRHAFETSVITSFEAACADAEKKCDSAVEAAEAAISIELAAKANSAANLEAAEGAAAKTQEQRAAATCHQNEKQTAKQSADTALKDAQAAVADASSKQGQMATDSEAFEKDVAEVFPALKDGAFAPKDWRLRQKAISRLSQLLRQSVAPESLISACQVAFKEKPECRGPFAAKTIEAAEVLLQSYTEACKHAITEAGSKLEELRVVVTQAELAAQAAQSELEAAQTSMISEDNSWLEAADAVTHIKLAIKNFDQKQEDLTSELEQSRASLQRFRELMDQFRALKDPPPPEAVAEAEDATAAAAGAARAEAPAAANTGEAAV